MNILDVIGRNAPLFEADVRDHESTLAQVVSASRFLVIGGAGSIGQAVTREIFKRKPRVLHVVDISENNMVELVRDIRSKLATHRFESTHARDIDQADDKSKRLTLGVERFA